MREKIPTHLNKLFATWKGGGGDSGQLQTLYAGFSLTRPSGPGYSSGGNVNLYMYVYVPNPVPLF